MLEDCVTIITSQETQGKSKVEQYVNINDIREPVRKEEAIILDHVTNQQPTDDQPILNYYQTRHLHAFPGINSKQLDSDDLMKPEPKHVTTISVNECSTDDDVVNKSGIRSSAQYCPQESTHAKSGLRSAVEMIPQEAIYGRSQEKLVSSVNVDRSSPIRDGIINNVSQKHSMTPSARLVLPSDEGSTKNTMTGGNVTSIHLGENQDGNTAKVVPNQEKTYKQSVYISTSDSPPEDTCNVIPIHDYFIKKNSGLQNVNSETSTSVKIPISKVADVNTTTKVESAKQGGTLIKIHHENTTPSVIKTSNIISNRHNSDFAQNPARHAPVRIPIHHSSDKGYAERVNVSNEGWKIGSKDSGRLFGYKPFERFGLLHGDRPGTLIFSTPFAVQHADYLKKTAELKSSKPKFNSGTRQIPINVSNKPASLTANSSSSLFVNKPFSSLKSNMDSSKFGSDWFIRRPWMLRSSDLMDDMQSFMNSSKWLVD